MAEIAGLKLIVPSSVAGSGVSVSASGKVTFTAATSMNINGVFSATYDNYLIVVRYASASGGVALFARMRSAGTDDSGNNYAYQYLNAENTSVSGGRSTSQNVARVGQAASDQRQGEHIYIYGPYLAQPTAFRNVNAGALTNASITDYAATHSLSTSYDGITLSAQSSNLTGALTIYGLSQ